MLLFVPVSHKSHQEQKKQESSPVQGKDSTLDGDPPDPVVKLAVFLIPFFLRFVLFCFCPNAIVHRRFVTGIAPTQATCMTFLKCITGGSALPRRWVSRWIPQFTAHFDRDSEKYRRGISQKA